MVSFTVNATKREDLGKGASRRLRLTGMIPAVVYGEKQDSIILSLKHSEMARHLQDEAFYSHVLSLEIDGTVEKVLLKDIQRHPYKSIILHVDFLRIDENKEITTSVPLHVINMEECLGVKQSDGVLAILEKSLEITCLPKNLPSYIEIDVSDLEINTSIHLSDITLPENVIISALDGSDAHDKAVITVRKLKGASIDEDNDEIVEETPETE